jgi:hypothetical protein
MILITYLFNNNNMNYYIHNGIIHVTEAVLDYTPLTEEQTLFFEANPSASGNEVLNCELYTLNVPTLEEQKAFLVSIVSNNYTTIVNSNVDATLTPLVYDGAKNGLPKCTATFNWFKQRGIERATKIQAINSATTIEDATAVDVTFTETVKPCTAEELMNEALSL